MTENESDLSKRIKELERALKQKELELKDKEKELKHEQAHRRAMEILIELANEHYHIPNQAGKKLHNNQGYLFPADCHEAFSLLGARVFSDIDVIVFIG